MKKIVTLALALILCVGSCISFASCGGEKADFTVGVCQLMEKELGIPANRTYVSYWGTDQWGWNGGNF